MEKITLQRVFDLAWQAFIVEGKPPSVYHGACRYLTPDGRRCAIGLALPDGSMALERWCSFATLVDTFPELFDEEIVQRDRIYLNEFQRHLHDCLVDDSGWVDDIEYRKEWYRQVAKNFGLSIPGEIV